MKKRILLATDFSKNSHNAIDYAMNLFKDDLCEFYILNTYDVDAFSMEFTAIKEMDQSKKKSIAGLSKILDRLSKSDSADNHQFHMVSEFGSLIDVMEKFIDLNKIDMVVMGTKGDTDSSTKIYGGQTVLAMEKIRCCPVLAIPPKAVFQGIKKIVFPTGYKTSYKRTEFQYLLDIVKKTGAIIHVLHVLEKDKLLTKHQLNNQELLKEYFEGHEFSFHRIYNNAVQLTVNSFIDNEDIDLVVFINKKHNFITWVLSTPMVKNLTYHAKVPILALHDLKN